MKFTHPSTADITSTVPISLNLPKYFDDVMRGNYACWFIF
jgi:hypothetical protein